MIPPQDARESVTPPAFMPDAWRNSPYSTVYRYIALTDSELAALVDAGFWNIDIALEVRGRGLKTEPFIPPPAA